MKHLNRILIIAFSFFIIACNSDNAVIPPDIVFTVQHEWDYAPKSEVIYIQLDALQKRYGTLNISNYDLIDLNNYNNIEFQLIDVNKDNIADYFSFTMPVFGREPLRPFKLRAKTTTSNIEIVQQAQVKNKLNITFLKPASELKTDSIQWSTTVAKTMLELYPDTKTLEVFSPGVWSYTNGLFINALCELYMQKGNRAYLKYAKDWIDSHISDEGEVYHYDQGKFKLDDVLPARALLYLNKITPHKKYKIAANNFIEQLEKQPKTSDGGYWHKKRYENQMWLDGIYMADVFTTQYAKQFNKAELYDEAIHQIKLIYKHTKDTVTGLMYHGWDESKNKIWANQKTGCSPEFWTRGIGWYLMALVDVLDYLPENHPQRPEIIEILNNLASSVANYQEKESGLWYQVTNKMNQSGNWIETSGSAMFAYAFAKGAKKGYLPQEYYKKAKEAFNGIISGYVYLDDDNHFYLTRTVKVGTLNFKHSDGSYNYYINVDCRINDFKGINSFLCLAMQMEY